MKKLDELQLMPELFGVVHDSGKNANVVSLRGYGVGDRKADAIGAALALKNFQKLDISTNRLTHVGARHLLTQLTPQCLELDVHANRVGVYGCLTISNCILRSNVHHLMALNLGMNGLNDEAIRDLASGLVWAKDLRRLNVSSNNISSNSASALVNALAKGGGIEELAIAWNQIGTAALVALLKIKTLLHLNVGWNSLGSAAGSHDDEGAHTDFSVGVQAVADALATNKTLLHLDLSGNSFGVRSLGIIAGGLASNHSLIGLHLDSQQHCVVDSLCFVHVPGYNPDVDGADGDDDGVGGGGGGSGGDSGSGSGSGGGGSTVAVDGAADGTVSSPSSGSPLSRARRSSVVGALTNAGQKTSGGVGGS